MFGRIAWAMFGCNAEQVLKETSRGVSEDSQVEFNEDLLGKFLADFHEYPLKELLEQFLAKIVLLDGTKQSSLCLMRRRSVICVCNEYVERN